MRRNPRWLYAELNRSTHTNTHRHRHRLWQWQRQWQAGTGRGKLGLHLCIMPSRKTHAQQARRSGNRLQVPQLNLHFRWLIFRSYSHIMSACAGARLRKRGAQAMYTYIKKKTSVETMPTTDAATATAATGTAAAAAATRRWLCGTHARWTRILRLRGRGVAWSRVIHANTRTQLNEFMLFKLQQSQHSCSSSSSRGAILQVWSVTSIVIDSDAINRVIRRRKQRHLASLSCSSIVGKSDQQLSWQFINLQILLPKFLKTNKLAIYCMICKICCQTP